jgi:hypothetical protein
MSKSNNNPALDAARYSEIPEELRALPNWLVWKRERRVNKKGEVHWTSVPYCARTGTRAKSNDPSTWSTFDEALAALEAGGYDGLGFAFTPPYVGADLDGCRVDGIIEPWAEEIIRELDSYTELSPSTHGVHAIVKGDLPDGRRQKEFGDREHHGVGLYDSARARYFTVTGNRIGGNGTIAERTQELHRIHARLFPPDPKTKQKAKAKANGAASDDALIQRAKKANDGGKFTRLWLGQWESDYASQSEADLALCRKLAFWTNRDAGRIDALFRRSALMRDKWDRADYREATIAKAIEKTTETWKPSGPYTATVNLNAFEPSLELLNALDIFAGRIRFQAVSRRGSMILATTAAGQQIMWPTMTDLASFSRARACIAEGADILLPQPKKGEVNKVWDPAANLLIGLSALDAIRVEHVLKAECKDLLILMWRYAKQPSAKDSKKFMEYMIAISKSVRDREHPAPPCVFIAEEHCWVHVPTFRNWISLSSLTNRLYPLADIRQGLLLLGFEYQKDVTRGADGDSESASLWRGPIDVLME